MTGNYKNNRVPLGRGKELEFVDRNSNPIKALISYGLMKIWPGRGEIITVTVPCESAITTVSADTSLDNTFWKVLVNTNGGNKMITFPDPTTCKDKEYRIMNIGTNQVSIVSSGTIVGIVILNQNETICYTSDGSKWYTI